MNATLTVPVREGVALKPEGKHPSESALHQHQRIHTGVNGNNK